MKVICAGAPKTGTKSVAKALRYLGYENGLLFCVNFLILLLKFLQSYVSIRILNFDQFTLKYLYFNKMKYTKKRQYFFKENIKSFLRPRTLSKCVL